MINFNSKIQEYITDSKWDIKENSNNHKSLQHLYLYLLKDITKRYYFDEIFGNIKHVDLEKIYNDGFLHIHDLDNISVYCVGHDLQNLLLKGFNGVSSKISAGPAKHLNVALMQCCNFLFTMQGEAAGAQAFSNFDTLLAPFIKADGLSYKQVKQEIQTFIYNMNVPTRTGFQTPFTNVTMDLTVPKDFSDRYCIIGGEPSTFKYKECQKEMDMFNKAFAEVMTEGDYIGNPFTFPVITYNVTKKFELNDVTKAIIKSTIKYGVPTFSNYINSDLDPDDIRSMCCRLRIDNTKLKQVHRASQFGSAPLTGAVCVTTINLPLLAISIIKDSYNYKELNIEDRLCKLKEKITYFMDIASLAMEAKRNVIEDWCDKGMYPYLKEYMKDVKEQTGNYFSNHFSVIGVIGINEVIKYLTGEKLGDSKKSIEIAEDILRFMNTYCDKLSAFTGSLYNLEATPAEGTCYSLALKTEKYCKEHKIAFLHEGTIDAPYLTNSSHLPHENNLNVIDILNKQDKLQTIYTGGTTLPIYIGEKLDIQNDDHVKGIYDFIIYICSNYKLPYFTLNTIFNVCVDHGYSQGDSDICKTCGKETEIYSRIVGYLRPVKQWNKGKEMEFKQRNYIESFQTCT